MPFDLRLRGFTSFFQSYEPLILVDGVPEANLSFLDPQEIASITIVKDLATAAAYGFRAGNGVVAIQTHQPASKGLNIRYQTYGAFSRAAETVDVLSSASFRSLASNNAFAVTDQGFDTDWQEEILRDAAFSNMHHLSFSGAHEGLAYRASLSYRNIQGVVRESGYQQLGGRLFAAYTGWQDRIRLTSNTMITQRDFQNFDYDFPQGITGGRRNAPIAYALQTNPTIPVWENNNPEGGIYAPNQSIFAENPLSRLNQTINDQNRNYIIHSNTVDLQLAHGLKARGQYGLIYQQHTHGFQAASNAVISLESFLDVNSGALLKTLQRQHWLDGQLQYQRQWNKHNLQAIAGYAYQYNRQDQQLYYTTSLPNADFSYRELNDSGRFPPDFVPTIDGERSSRALSSYYASMAHQYEGWSLAGNFRFEGASNLGRAARWHRYFGITGGFDFATLWGNFPLITQLRLRAGYGTAANLPRESYLAQELIGETGEFTFFDGVFIPVEDIIQVGNPHLQPEKSRAYNIGVDATLFNGRLRGSLDIFSRRTTDIITTQLVPITSFDFRRQYINIGELTNFGADGHLIMDVLQRDGFRWQLGFRGSVHQQRIDQLNAAPFNADSRILAGLSGLFRLIMSRHTFAHHRGLTLAPSSALSLSMSMNLGSGTSEILIMTGSIVFVLPISASWAMPSLILYSACPTNSNLDASRSVFSSVVLLVIVSSITTASFLKAQPSVLCPICYPVYWSRFPVAWR
jgi:TonB-dependent SusC/RagA subfamily outer membrane receptor